MSTFSNNLKACSLLCCSTTTIKGQHFHALAPGFFRTRPKRLSVFKVAQKTLCIMKTHLYFDLPMINKFIRCFHNFPKSFKDWAVVKENKILLFQNNFFFSVCQLKKNHDNYLLKKIVDYEFEIGETISDEFFKCHTIFLRLLIKLKETNRL